MIKLLTSASVAYAGSALLYADMHNERVPELARYGVGSVLIALISYILYEDEDFSLRVLLCIVLAGLGISVNRIRLQIGK